MWVVGGGCVLRGMSQTRNMILVVIWGVKIGLSHLVGEEGWELGGRGGWESGYD